MKIKQILGVGLGVGMLATGVTVSMAQADPSGTPTFRALAGVGSDTTQGVMNGLAQVIKDGSGNKLIASYDAVGSATIKTKATGCDSIARPNGSGAGRTALMNSVNANDGCLQFARSSSISTTATTPGLTYIPYAVDAVTYMVTSASTLPRSLSLADLKAIYMCQGDPTIKPLIPQSGSGTRAFWLGKLSITEAQINAGSFPCIKDKVGSTPIEEHDGRVLDPLSIAPISIAQYISQASSTIPDLRGSAQLGTIDGVASVSLNNSAPLKRDVYNVVPTSKLTDPTVANVFVGPGSQVCQNSALIQQFGFGLKTGVGGDLACGDTSQHS